MLQFPPAPDLACPIHLSHQHHLHHYRIVRTITVKQGISSLHTNQGPQANHNQLTHILIKHWKYVDQKQNILNNEELSDTDVDESIYSTQQTGLLNLHLKSLDDHLYKRQTSIPTKSPAVSEVVSHSNININFQQIALGKLIFSFSVFSFIQ